MRSVDKKAMTIGALSRRTGLPVKTLREYESLGLIYTVGRSPGNYRLFNEEALWCVDVVTTLRSLGLTLAEIVALGTDYQLQGEPFGKRLTELLQVARRRAEARISELRQIVQRIDEFTAAHEAELAGERDIRAQDPHFDRRGG